MRERQRKEKSPGNSWLPGRPGSEARAAVAHPLPGCLLSSDGDPRYGVALDQEETSYLDRSEWQKQFHLRLAMRTESIDPVTTKDVFYALGRYRIESNESDRQTATKLGINCLTLKAWLRGVAPPQRCLLARLAGFLRRVGYL